jgi:hypothetical protein
LYRCFNFFLYFHQFSLSNIKSMRKIKVPNSYIHVSIVNALKGLIRDKYQSQESMKF